MVQHCKALQTPSWQDTAQTLPRALRAARPAPPAPHRVRGCKLGTWPKTSSQQEAGEGGRGLRLALGKVNQQIQLIQCGGEKGPSFYLLPRAPEFNTSFVGCPSTLQKRKSGWTQGSVSGQHWSAKTRTPMAALSASLFRSIAVPAAVGWDVTALKR